MAEQEKTVISDGSGDGDVLKGLPQAMAGIARTVELKSRNARQTRLLRTCARLLPPLRRMEEISIEDQEARALTGLRFSDALKDATAIERCLHLFQDAWDSGLIEIRTGAGKVVKAGDRKTIIGSCGMTVADVLHFLLYEAARRVMKKHKNLNLDIPGLLSGPEVLPRIKILKSMDPKGLVFLQRALGKTFSDLLTLEDLDKVTAIAKLKAYHIKGLEKALTHKVGEFINWDAELITAIAEALTCPEQVNDLGEFIALIKEPDAFRAIGGWELRDITDKVNAERKERAKKSIKGPVYDTDISLIERMIGRDFALLMEQPATVLGVTGELVNKIKAIEEKKERAATTELFKQFVNRYLEYMSAEAVGAMHMTGDGDVIEIHEAVGMLEGLWNKQQLGRPFFENHLKEDSGAKALDALVKSFIDMKKRGSIKADSDVGSVIATSDLFDGALKDVM